MPRPSLPGKRLFFRSLFLHGLMLGLVGLLFGLAAIGIWGYRQLQASLPQLDGEVMVAGLAAPVKVTRDALGIPSIQGRNRLDVARASGFLHAQDRYFQMDLLRRSAAGELAALLGEAALIKDRQVRIHRFRARARDIIAELPGREKTVLDAYTAGVNAGLTELRVLPFEYLLLRQEPLPWRMEDSILVVYAMYLDLQARQRYLESSRGLMHDVLPDELYTFLSPWGSEWDAPLEGGPLAAPPLPSSESIDLRKQPVAEVVAGVWIEQEPSPMIGSNNWAVAGRHTVHGGALLADDMHLGIRVPNTWYRARFIYLDEHQRERRISGVTLPGTPVMVVGSNEQVAWGFTNTGGDWSDLVILEPGPDQDSYLTPDGAERFQHFQETIGSKDGPDQSLDVRWTRWGPVVDTDHQGRQRVLRWVAHERRGVNMGLLALETADTIEQALQAANRAGIPAQNIMLAGADGRIAWTIAGPIPRRFGHYARIPRSWADGHSGWDGWLEPEEYPRIVDPPSGRLWTANARVLSEAWLPKLGDGNYALGARARQIRDALLNGDQFEEQNMLALQLDDQALFLERWRDLLLTVLTPQALEQDPRRRELRTQVEQWGGRAAVDSVGFQMVRAFRLFLAEQVFQPLVAPCKVVDEDFQYQRITQYEGPLWRLVQERPEHLLNPRYRDWQTQFLAAVDAMLDYFFKDGSRLAEHTWGKRNTSRIAHPLSRFIPGAGHWLDMPAVPLPGDKYMPRVQTPSKGASQRMVVSPGREEHGIFHMPVGQSGHPLSPHYGDAHMAWVYGEATPFLPGPMLNSLVLQPEMTSGSDTH